MKNAAILHLSSLCLQPAAQAQAQGSGTRFRHYADGRADVRRDSRYGFADVRYEISLKFQYR